MKNKIAIASAFLAASSFSMGEIVVNDFLSFEGFVDMSYQHGEAEAGSGAAKQNESQNSYDIDQVEISWLFNFDTVTAQVDLAHEGSDNSDYEGTDVEQAFVTYHLDNGGAITAGRYASMLGFEAFEPTGLYQSSFAYTGGIALDQQLQKADPTDDSDSSVLPGYDQGVKYTYESDNTFYGISLVDGSYNRGRLGGDTEGLNNAAADSGYGVEVAGAYSIDNGVSVFLGARYDDGDTADTTTYNAYVTYETGAWLFAAELAYNEEDADANNADSDALNALLLANYAYSDVASVTGRLSYVDGTEEDGTTAPNEDDLDFFKYTLAHNYAFTDNLLLRTELSYLDGEFSAAGAADSDFDETTLVVEVLFSF
jgi:hypothetical protein